MTKIGRQPMSNMTRGILIAACVIGLFYLAIQFGTGISGDPDLEAPIAEAENE
jgi:hypothetical protein